MEYKEQKELTYDQAKEKALRLLAFRSHSEKELAEKLRRSGGKQEDIPGILDFCREYKFLDDRAYAKKQAKDLAKLKKYGKKRISAELYSKGIAREWIDEALEELEDEEEAVLLPLVQKKLGGNFEKKNQDKVIRYFLYRGYSFGDIKSCLERIINDGI